MPYSPRALPAAVQDADEQEQGPIMTAAQIAEEEARECVTEVVEVMMQESVATMAPAPYGSLPPRLWLDNVDALLKRQVTMYKEHRDRVTGVVTPAPLRRRAALCCCLDIIFVVMQRPSSCPERSPLSVEQERE